MNQTITSWSKTQLFFFRLFPIYLILYILFISDFISFYGDVIPVLSYINKPFIFVTESFMRLINLLFIHGQSVPTLDFQSDTFWGARAVLSFFIVAIVIAMAWTKFDKKRSHPVLFSLVYTIARYYLAYIFFSYGMAKVFGNQFGYNSQNALLYSLPDLNPHQLFWSFMGTSRSYQIFAGIIEIIPGILLLFRSTTILGALVALPVTANVLMLNIGYDTRLKIFLLHLFIISLFILAPSIKRLFNFILFKKNETLAACPTIPLIARKKWLAVLIKISFICLVVFLEFSFETRQVNERKNAPQNALVGLHSIKQFRFINNSAIDNSKAWKRISVTPYARFSVQFANDSTTSYFFDSVTSERMELVTDADTSFKCRLSYKELGPAEWFFSGTLKNDSISFTSTKIDLNKTTLLKDYGKVKWLYED